MNHPNQLQAMKMPSIHAGRSFGILGHAHVCEGSVVRKTFIGWSPSHAVKRAKKMFNKSVPVQIGFS